MKNKTYYYYLGSCCLLLFVFLGYCVRFYPNWLAGFDTAIIHVTATLRPGFTPFFLWITKFANPITVILLTCVIIASLLLKHKFSEALWLLVGVSGISGLLANLLKILFTRTRPSHLLHLVTEASYSFPSGHANASMVLYGTLIALLPTLIPEKKLRITLQVLLGIVIFLVGFSRVYLGVHYPSDIIGGFSLGAAWLFFSYPFYDQLRFRWRFQNKQK